jgi:hypothetical protein
MGACFMPVYSFLLTSSAAYAIWLAATEQYGPYFV